ncbi:MAG TPA: hypothetical protein VKX41_19065 [Alloacidobacterium sp.]|nr:hypothetical protein [Alloacidobacterium sp.]
MYIFLILLSGLAFFPAFIAHQKGHSFALWWLYGATLFPLALPHSLFLNGKTVQTEKALEKECPYCRESMPVEDDFCPSCHFHLYDPAFDGPAILTHRHA